MTMTADAETQGVFRGILESLSDQKIVVAVAGTDYQLHLTPAAPAAQISTAVGKRIKGTVHAKALRLFKAAGGGRFIEPIIGEPRIVAGAVLAVDEPNRRLLVDVGIPMWLALSAGQAMKVFNIGDLVNCYVESDTTFRPM